MMWRCIEFVWICMLFMVSCSPKPSAEYRQLSNGIRYKLLSFDPNFREKTRGDLLLISLSFSTQSDSLFWDSHNNFNDMYVVPVQSWDTISFSSCLSRFNPGDSMLLLVPAAKFFREQFQSQRLPDFCANDTIIKVSAKIQCFVTAEELQERKELLRERETGLIRDYLKQSGLEGLKADSSGVYWLQKPEPFSLAGHNPGQNIKIQYEGRFLNGRIFERTASDFELYYALPDQLIKGLNYVMHFLREGQNAKIILPSALAFGDGGSSNGTVPPFTPVLYQINCIHVKQK